MGGTGIALKDTDKYPFGMRDYCPDTGQCPYTSGKINSVG
jgi:hypothetical protein